jgi:hypothetical protein
MNELIDIFAQHGIWIKPYFSGLQYKTWHKGTDPAIVVHWRFLINGEVFDYYQGAGYLLPFPMKNSDREKRDYVVKQYKALGVETDRNPVIVKLGSYKNPYLDKPASALAPSIEDLMECLVNEAEAAQKPLREFLDEMGFDDQLEGLTVHRECEETARKLWRALGAAYEDVRRVVEEGWTATCFV